MAASLWSKSAIGLYLLIAVVLAATAFLSSFEAAFLGTFSALLFVSALIAAAAEFVNVYAASGNTPGPPVPVKTIATFAFSALIYAGSWLAGQHDITTYTGIAGALLFLGYLEQELTGQALPTPIPNPPTS